MPITISSFDSPAAHMVMAGAPNYVPSLPIPYSLCPQLVMVTCWVGE